jgi:heme/copper-type cytochrome/quinol oxidase subunit 4
MSDDTDPVVSWLLTIGAVVAIFFSLFMYMMLGMAVSEFAANIFLLCVLAAAAIIAAGRYWWRKQQHRP